jgi:hypothetical protein
VAWAGHAPGLWIFYQESLPSTLRWPNFVAVTVTVGATITAVSIAARVEWMTVVIPWAAGHVLWGTYLAWRLPARAQAPTKGHRVTLPRWCTGSCPACTQERD